jgi:hypothetical protein
VGDQDMPNIIRVAEKIRARPSLSLDEINQEPIMDFHHITVCSVLDQGTQRIPPKFRHSAQK